MTDQKEDRACIVCGAPFSARLDSSSETCCLKCLKRKWRHEKTISPFWIERYPSRFYADTGAAVPQGGPVFWQVRILISDCTYFLEETGTWWEAVKIAKRMKKNLAPKFRWRKIAGAVRR